MAHRAYWLDVDAQHGYVDIFINDLPATRLGPLGGTNAPITEYTARGPNRGVLKAASRAPADRIPGPEQTSAVAVKLVEVVYQDLEEISRRTLVEETAAAPLVPGSPAPMLSFAFEAEPPRSLPDLAGFQPIGPNEHRMIADHMRTVAGWWAAGDAEKLVGWLGPYISDYIANYPVETEDEYRDAFRRMVGAYAPPHSRLDFAPAALALEICGYGRFADCRSRAREGAAIRLVKAVDDYYDFNIVVGVKGGAVVAVR